VFDRISRRSAVKPGFGYLYVELGDFAVVAYRDLEFGPGHLNSGPGFLERLVFGQGLDEVDSVLYRWFTPARAWSTSVSSRRI
jgi:hypothetical protein